jgi:hypothetical protein
MSRFRSFPELPGMHGDASAARRDQDSRRGLNLLFPLSSGEYTVN